MRQHAIRQIMISMRLCTKLYTSTVHALHHQAGMGWGKRKFNLAKKITPHALAKLGNSLLDDYDRFEVPLPSARVTSSSVGTESGAAINLWIIFCAIGSRAAEPWRRARALDLTSSMSPGLKSTRRTLSVP